MICTSSLKHCDPKAIWLVELRMEKREWKAQLYPSWGKLQITLWLQQQDILREWTSRGKSRLSLGDTVLLNNQEHPAEEASRFLGRHNVLLQFQSPNHIFSWVERTSARTPVLLSSNLKPGEWKKDDCKTRYITIRSKTIKHYQLSCTDLRY